MILLAIVPSFLCEQIVGYYSWNWGSGSKGPEGATIGVAFTGLNNVSQAIAGYPPNATWCCPPLVGSKYISLGGGNAAGIMTETALVSSCMRFFAKPR